MNTTQTLLMTILKIFVGNHPVLSDQEKSDIKSLYGYKRKKIRELREKVLTTSNGYKKSSCPICGANLVQTMDHFIPQADYPLFVVHPKNLIPCCQTCNEHKSSTVVDEYGKRKYWYAYIDKVPKEKFLYCTISEKEGVIEADFSLQRGTIDETLFEKIQHTLEDQQVLETYKDGSGDAIEEFADIVKTHIEKSSLKDFDICIKEIREFIASYDSSNDWRKVLRHALINSEIFINHIKSE